MSPFFRNCSIFVFLNHCFTDPVVCSVVNLKLIRSALKLRKLRKLRIMSVTKLTEQNIQNTLNQPKMILGSWMFGCV